MQELRQELQQLREPRSHYWIRLPMALAKTDLRNRRETKPTTTERSTNMKNATITTLLALICALGLIIGCGQKEQTPPESPAQVEKSTEAAPAETPKAAEAPAPALPAVPEVAPAAAAATSEAQGLIDKAKSLVAENKYTEAMNVLKELSALKLTPDQQQIVDDLKAQVEKALQAQATSEATKSVGGLLGK
jgi:hypothetical protein